MVVVSLPLYFQDNILEEFRTTKIEDALCTKAAAIGFKKPKLDRATPAMFTNTAKTMMFCLIMV